MSYQRTLTILKNPHSKNNYFQGLSKLRKTFPESNLKCVSMVLEELRVIQVVAILRIVRILNLSGKVTFRMLLS
jgi:hypothetical protein